MGTTKKADTQEPVYVAGTGQRYELRRDAKGRIVCLDRETNEHAPLSRCVSLELPGGDHDGITVRMDRSKCRIQPDTREEMMRRIRAGGTTWAYESSATIRGIDDDAE